LRVALFKHHPAYPVHPSVVRALEQAAVWLSEAGCVVEEAVPPHFEEASALWGALVFNDLRRAGVPAIERMGDAGVQAALRHYLHDCPDWSRDEYLQGLARRFSIARDWAQFFATYPVLLMPNSWEVQFPIDEDTRSPQRMRTMLAAQSPLLATALLGLPGLSVPTGESAGLPTGVQLVATRFREDLLLQVGEWIEQRAGWQVLEKSAKKIK
jgi:amidase